MERVHFPEPLQDLQPSIWSRDVRSPKRPPGEKASYRWKETRAFSLGGRLDQVSLLPFLITLLNYVRRIVTEVLKGYGNQIPLEFVWDQHHKTRVFMT